MLRNYLLTASKVFMRRKLYTAINLACIVLTLVVLMVITALLEHAFYPSGVEGKGERLLQIIFTQWVGPEGKGNRIGPLGYKLIEQNLRPLKSPELVAAVTMPKSVAVYQQGRISTVRMRHADAAYWKILDFKVLSGRLPNEDDVAQARRVAVLNASTAARLFPATTALGQKFIVDNQQFEVLGVVEDVLQLNAYADIWAPVTTLPSSNYRNESIGAFTALILARSSADVPRVQQEVAQAARHFQFDDPKQWRTAYFWADSKVDVFARVLLGRFDQADSGASALLTRIAVLMLLFMLLPALNLVNLNMGRIMERSAEIGVRKAFGATSMQLVWQLVIENVLLCLAGGALSLLCAAAVLSWLEASQLIPYLEVSINLAVFVGGLLITVVFGLLSGVIPAWKMSRLDPVFALKGAA